MKILLAYIVIMAGMGTWELLAALVHLKEGRYVEGDLAWLIALVVSVATGGVMQWLSKRRPDAPRH